jgi:hypothetical protein
MEADRQRGEALGRRLVGLTEAEAEAVATDEGVTLTVVGRDGVAGPMTLEYRTRRLRLVLKHGRVVDFVVG